MGICGSKGIEARRPEPVTAVTTYSSSEATIYCSTSSNDQKYLGIKEIQSDFTRLTDQDKKDKVRSEIIGLENCNTFFKSAHYLLRISFDNNQNFQSYIHPHINREIVQIVFCRCLERSVIAIKLMAKLKKHPTCIEFFSHPLNVQHFGTCYQTPSNHEIKYVSAIYKTLSERQLLNAGFVKQYVIPFALNALLKSSNDASFAIRLPLLKCLKQVFISLEQKDPGSKEQPTIDNFFLDRQMYRSFQHKLSEIKGNIILTTNRNDEVLAAQKQIAIIELLDWLNTRFLIYENVLKPAPSESVMNAPLGESHRRVHFSLQNQ